MVPWQVATGLTLALGGAGALLLDRMEYLEGAWGGIASVHGAGLAGPVLTGFASVFAALHWTARKLGLGDLGRKVEHIDRGLRDIEGAAHDRELATALQRDRAARWDRRDPAG